MKMFDYDFKCVNPTDYKLNLELAIEGRVMQHVFFKARQKLKRSKNITVPDNDMEDLGRIDVPESNYKLVLTGIRSTLNKVEAELKDENHEIVLVTRTIEKIFYEKIKGEFRCVIVLNGRYVDKKYKGEING